MSSTKRGGQKSEADFYPTPAWCTRRLLERLRLPEGDWLEPGAGDGALIRAVSEKRQDIRWTALELREECAPRLKLPSVKDIIITDKFVEPGVPEEKKPLYGRLFDVAFGNPPFSLAMPFIHESLRYCDNVVFLLRLNYMGSEERNAWMKDHMPDIYILPNRPSFRGDGQTDSIEYAWYHWNKNNLRRTDGKVTLLGLTSAKERKQDRLDYDALRATWTE